MKEIELLVRRENALAKQNLLYQLLGKFGDDLPKKIQDDITIMAQQETSDYNKLGSKVADKLK